MVNMYIHFPMHKCIGLKVIFNFLITRNWTLVYLICLDLEFAKKSFKLNYVSQEYECVFILNFCDKWSMRVLQVLYPHILIYKDALLFCINIWHYVLKEYLWFIIWIIILFELADLHESWMVPLTISCDGFPVWNLICNESL